MPVKAATPTNGHDGVRVARVEQPVYFIDVQHVAADREMVVVVLVGRQAEDRELAADKLLDPLAASAQQLGEIKELAFEE